MLLCRLSKDKERNPLKQVPPPKKKITQEWLTKADTFRQEEIGSDKFKLSTVK